MFEEFEKATGVKVNFVRFSSGEALARVIAEEFDPRVDVLFGGPVETYTAGINEGLLGAVAESRRRSRGCPSDSAVQRAVDGDRRRSAGVHDQRQVSEREQLRGATSEWNDLLAAPYKNMLQMADARTSGTAVTGSFRSSK